MKRSEYLMTRPSTFGVSYTINPWMQPQAWQRNRQALIGNAKQSWQALYDTLTASGSKIHLLDPVIPLPELVFPTNSAIVLDGKVLMSSFSRAERKREQPVFLKHMNWLCEKGVVSEVGTISARTPQEGSGDCRWDSHRQLFWAGFGQRSHHTSHQRIAEFFKTEVVSIELIDPRFYQVSMALCCLDNGDVMYFPEAISADSLAVLKEHVAPENRIEVSLADASAFNLNLLALDKTLLMTPPSPALRDELKQRGYQPKLVNVLPFTMAGASVGSLALRLDQKRRRDMFVRKPIIQNVGDESLQSNEPLANNSQSRLAVGKPAEPKVQPVAIGAKKPAIETVSNQKATVSELGEKSAKAGRSKRLYGIFSGLRSRSRG